MNTLQSIILNSINNVDLTSITTDSLVKNIENYLYLLIILYEINRKISKDDVNINLTDVISYFKFQEPSKRPNIPEDQLDIEMLKELGPILSSYGYALANNIPVSINKNYNRVNFINSYGTLIALSRKKYRLTEYSNYLNSGDFNLPAVDSSGNIEKKIKNVITGATLR